MTSDDNDKKGFGGFGDLLSDVSEEVKTAAPKLASGSAPKVTQTTLSTSQQTSTPPRQPSPPPLPLDTSGGESGFGSGWVWAGLVFLIFIAIAVNSGEKEEATAPIEAPAYESSYETSTSSVDSAPAVEVPVAESAAVAFNNSEEMPPVGSDLVLTGNQIRYCLAEDVRLSTIKNAIDNYSQYEVKRFNGAIEDFNSRCSSYKYKRGTLESIQGEVISIHAPLVLEALERLDSWREKASSLPGETAPAKDAQSVAAQLEAESQSPAVIAQPNLSELSTSERSSIEAVCASDKYTKGPAAYNSCLSNQLAKLANAPARPNLNELSTSEQGSIEAVCASDKYTKGPAAYNACLARRLSQLR